MSVKHSITEDTKKFEYNNRIAIMYENWCQEQAIKGAKATFASFYDQLPVNERIYVNCRETIFRS
jgi:hypothetical protein